MQLFDQDGRPINTLLPQAPDGSYAEPVRALDEYGTEVRNGFPRTLQTEVYRLDGTYGVEPVLSPAPPRLAVAVGVCVAVDGAVPEPRRVGLSRRPGTRSGGRDESATDSRDAGARTEPAGLTAGHPRQPASARPRPPARARSQPAGQPVRPGLWQGGSVPIPLCRP